MKIIDYTTGHLLRVLYFCSFNHLDVNWSSSNTLGSKVPSKKPGYSCKWMYRFCCYCLELEKERSYRYNSHYAKLDDYFLGLASNVCFYLSFHSKRRIYFNSVWNDCLSLELPEKFPIQSLSLQWSQVSLCLFLRRWKGFYCL